MNPEHTKIERRKAPDFHPCRQGSSPHCNGQRPLRRTVGAALVQCSVGWLTNNGQTGWLTNNGQTTPLNRLCALAIQYPCFSSNHFARDRRAVRGQLDN